MRASGRSVLLTTRITGRCAASALRSTKRVCGSGPSDASTSSSTPSTIERPRSTSPPKSAWPGVSITLITVTVPSAWWRCTAVFLARIVMPFSRSRSPESRMRSVAAAPRCVSAPDCRSIASTRVVLPWSTWATMATLRKSGRESTSVILPVRSANHENERCPSLEAQRAVGPQTQEEVLPQQAALQAVSSRRAPNPQGGTQRHAGQETDEGVQARSKPVIRPPLTGFGRTVSMTHREWLEVEAHDRRRGLHHRFNRRLGNRRDSGDLRRTAQLDWRLLRRPVCGMPPSDVLVGEPVTGVLPALPSPGVDASDPLAEPFRRESGERPVALLSGRRPAAAGSERRTLFGGRVG